jgi:hypothetical protein
MNLWVVAYIREVVRIDVLGPEAATLEDLVQPRFPLVRRNVFGRRRTDVGQDGGCESGDIRLHVVVEA